MALTKARYTHSTKPQSCCFCKDPIETEEWYAAWHDREYNAELRRWSVTTYRAHFYCHRAQLKRQQDKEKGAK